MMDFIGALDHFTLNPASWRRALGLARLYGWEPAGTLPPQAWEDRWDANYLTGDGQRVTAEDARNLAAALEGALPDVPDHDALTEKAVRIGELEARVIPAGMPANAFEWFSGKSKPLLVKFITFCRQGGFTIY
jgi:hypothetical protein